MGVLRRLGEAIGLRKREQPQNLVFEEAFWREIGLGIGTSSGETVTWRSALAVTTALRCGLVIADAVSTVPCKLMFRDPNTGKRRTVTGDEHPLADILGWKANNWMDSLQFRETMTLHTVFSGNGFAYIVRARGKPKELIPLRPECVRVQQDIDYTLRYFIMGLDGTEVEAPAEDIWHVRGPSWDGWRGMDTVHMAREAIGLAMATEKAHATRFRNGISPSGVYSVTGTLDADGYKRLRRHIEDSMAGTHNGGKPFVLDRDAKWTPTQMSGVDAEHVATRELQIQEICRAFGVMPIMVGFSDKTATYASAEQMFLAHAVNTARPWHRRMEASMETNLLTVQEFRKGYYIKFFDTELLRGAAADRAEYYGKMFQVGALSPNQVLELEDMDGFAGGDTHFVPANMMDAANPVAPQAGGTADPAKAPPKTAPQEK